MQILIEFSGCIEKLLSEIFVRRFLEHLESFLHFIYQNQLYPVVDATEINSLSGRNFTNEFTTGMLADIFTQSFSGC